MVVVPPLHNIAGAAALAVIAGGAAAIGYACCLCTTIGIFYCNGITACSLAGKTIALAGRSPRQVSIEVVLCLHPAVTVIVVVPPLHNIAGAAALAVIAGGAAAMVMPVVFVQPLASFTVMV
jgi:hypothetical protein